MNADLLVLDDLGAEKTSEWVEETMNLIVNTRYNERRLTIFTSNYLDIPDDTDPNSLLFRIGHRMRSRLHEMCEFVEMDGADYRELPAERRRRRPGHDVEERRKTLPHRARPPGPRPAARTGVRDGAPISSGRRPRRQLTALEQPSEAAQNPRSLRSVALGAGLEEDSWLDPTRSACTSTFRSVPRSATTATSTAACSTPI